MSNRTDLDSERATRTGALDAAGERPDLPPARRVRILAGDPLLDPSAAEEAFAAFQAAQDEADPRTTPRSAS